MVNKTKKIITAFVLVLMCFFAICVGACGETQQQKINYSQDVNDAKIINNFASIATNKYQNINGKEVSVDLFYRSSGEALNNPNFGQAVLISQCIAYKKAHPEKQVKISISSFHFSVYASACVDINNANFGKMKNLYNEESSDGFIRISYLLVLAAKEGINVLAIGQLDASGVSGKTDMDFVEYFDSHINDQANDGESLSKYLKYYRVGWTSYGDKAATDMMHLKSCAVSNYIDFNGIEHSGSVWFGSINLDGITDSGPNGNDGFQTGSIVSDHDEIANITFNFTSLMSKYCGQEDITEFRNIVSQRNAEQIDRILSGNSGLIKKEDQIVYMGSESDNVFELHFTPFASSVGAWDTKYNLFSKYINKLLEVSKNKTQIILTWNNANFKTNFLFSQTALSVIKTAFLNSANTSNKLYMHCHNYSENGYFDELVEGDNIGRKSINADMYWWSHAKDLQLSYFENNVRHYVTILNSLNFHEGALSYQINSCLVINETKNVGNRTFLVMGNALTKGIVNSADEI